MAHLFSIDLEHPRSESGGIIPGQQPLCELIAPLLELLKHYNSTATFFVVGQDVENDDNLIADILKCGHEIASHTYFHRPLDKVTRDEFETDLSLQHRLFAKWELSSPQGFRAPIFSLTKESAWVYQALASKGYTYSSSVLPAKSPMYGWDDFSCKDFPQLIEMPIPVCGIGTKKIPFSGGVYLRTIPLPCIKRLYRSFLQTVPLISYIHPYDFDFQSPKFKMHPNPFFDFLLYYNRRSTLRKVEWLLSQFGSMSFKNFLERNS